MRESTVTKICWLIFGCFWVFLFFGMYLVTTISEYNITTNHTLVIEADNETKSIMENMVKIQELQQKTCIVKEYDRYIDSETGEILSKYLINEYIHEECAYTKQ